MSLPYVIVPIYNGESSINDFINRLDEKWNNQLVFVDDGSIDNTFDLLMRKNVRLLKHEKNLGKGAAIQTAVDWIRNEGLDQAITIDIDLQHPPELLDEFIHVPNNTILLGYRFNRQNMPLLRKLSNFLTSLLISIRSCSVIKDSQCGYRSFKTHIFENIECFEQGFHFESEFLIKSVLAGWKIKHIPIPTIYEGQRSAMKNIKDTIKFVNMWLKSYFWT